MKHCIVRLSKSQDYSQTHDLHFDLVQSSFLPKWIDRYHEAEYRQDKISEPWAFYNLNDAWTEESIRNKLNYHIDSCNDISPGMFERRITDLKDHDDTNYLHWVFETTHGQLESWKQNPLFDVDKGPELQKHLSQINQTIHRCESHGKNPRMRIVYFDLPKTHTFTDEDYSLFTEDSEFGGLYTVYADVGKNLESLAKDQDEYVEDFVPNLHYSIDCQIRFWDEDGSDRKQLAKEYAKQHQDYFSKLGYSLDDPRMTTGYIKLGQLIYDNQQQVLDTVKQFDTIQNMFLF